MTQHFLINKNSTLPTLRMEVVCNGQHDFRKLYMALQGADVTFTMENIDTGVKRIANAPANVVKKDGNDCTEEYLLEYRWKPRDTKEAGIYRGQFKIRFSDKLSMDGVTFPTGELIVPIAEELIITISEGAIKN